MSLRDKLIAKYQLKYLKMQVNLAGDLEQLQTDCKHEKTHWMQELKSDGSLKGGLFKRCFVCGKTLETFDCAAEVAEKLVGLFDCEVEKVKKA